MSASSLREKDDSWYSEDMKFYDFLRESLRRLQGRENLSRFAKRAGVDRASLARFLDGERGLTGESIEKILDNLGFQLLSPGEKAETKDLKSEIDRINADVFRVLASRGVSSEIITEVQRAIMNIEAVEQPSRRQAAGE